MALKNAIRYYFITMAVLTAVTLQITAAAQDERPAAVKRVSDTAFQCLTQDDSANCFVDRGFACSQPGKKSRNTYSCYVSVGGYCYRRRFQLKDRGWSGSEDWTLGECEPTFEFPLADGVRAQYDNVNAPDSVRFRVLLSHIFREVVHDENPLGAARYLRSGMTATTDNQRLLDYFVAEQWNILNEIYNEQTTLLCDSSKPRFADSRLYSTFDEFDDIGIKVYEKHLRRVRAELASDDSFDLEKALTGIPGSFSTTIHATSGDLPSLQKRAELRCSTPLSMQFTSFEDVEK